MQHTGCEKKIVAESTKFGYAKNVIHVKLDETITPVRHSCTPLNRFQADGAIECIDENFIDISIFLFQICFRKEVTCKGSLRACDKV